MRWVCLWKPLSQYQMRFFKHLFSFLLVSGVFFRKVDEFTGMNLASMVSGHAVYKSIKSNFVLLLVQRGKREGFGHAWLVSEYKGRNSRRSSWRATCPNSQNVTNSTKLVFFVIDRTCWLDKYGLLPFWRVGSSGWKRKDESAGLTESFSRMRKQLVPIHSPLSRWGNDQLLTRLRLVSYSGAFRALAPI